jgi:hypothetical protein
MQAGIRKGTVPQDFRPSFFSPNNPPLPLTHGLDRYAYGFEFAEFFSLKMPKSASAVLMRLKKPTIFYLSFLLCVYEMFILHSSFRHAIAYAEKNLYEENYLFLILVMFLRSYLNCRPLPRSH